MRPGKALREAAGAAIAAQPGARVLPFSCEGEKYWLKRKQSNGRMQLVKYSVEQQFYYEAAHIEIASEASDHAPEMVLLTDDYFVLRDGGRSVHDWLLSDAPEAEKRHILQEAGKALCELHQAGLYHGRPAPRDIVWDGRRITFLDWENRTYFHDLPHRQMTDAALFLQGLYRERWTKDSYVRAAWDGYREAGGAAILLETGRFLADHKIISRLTGILHPFHFKDVEPLEKVYRWFASHEEELVHS